MASVVWIKHLYPKFLSRIEKIPEKIGKISVGAIVVFMSTNIAVSGLALMRSTERSHDIEAKTVWQQFMDERFPDERIAKIYPNMIQVK
jgi:hypothetical protein